MGLRRTLNVVLGPLGYRVVRARELELLYRHDYAGGYEEYRAAQIAGNRRHQDDRTPAWADPETLGAIASDLEANGLGQSGICHGARTGYEVEWLRERLGGDVIGTDIADTAAAIPNMETWDFHDERPEWRGRFDFVYTNALDHAFDPAKALRVWAGQVVPQGRIYVEHTMSHAPQAANATDPFGAHPLIMPHFLVTWGRGCFRLTDILEVDSKANMALKASVFVLTPIGRQEARA